MHLLPHLRTYEYEIKTIDSHTEGESTRIVYDGFPRLRGATMMEKKRDLLAHYDFLRRALMLEPRGHRDMFGAVLTEPVHEEAAAGVIFLDSGGCLNMCGHGSIGTASIRVRTSSRNKDSNGCPLRSSRRTNCGSFSFIKPSDPHHNDPRKCGTRRLNASNERSCVIVISSIGVSTPLGEIIPY